MPGPPPVMIVKPASPSRRAVSRAASYSGRRRRARRAEDGDRRPDVGERVEARARTRPDAQHAPRIGVGELGASAGDASRCASAVAVGGVTRFLVTRRPLRAATAAPRRRARSGPTGAHRRDAARSSTMRQSCTTPRPSRFIGADEDVVDAAIELEPAQPRGVRVGARPGEARRRPGAAAPTRPARTRACPASVCSPRRKRISSVSRRGVEVAHEDLGQLRLGVAATARRRRQSDLRACCRRRGDS